MITIKDVEHVAKLARLELTEDEKEKYTKQLSDVLKHVDAMNEVDTSNVEPMAHAIDFVNVMREDKVFYEQTKEELKNISASYRKAQLDYAKTANKLQQMNGERMSTSEALKLKEQADKQRERLMSASNKAAHFYENQKKGE